MDGPRSYPDQVRYGLLQLGHLGFLVRTSCPSLWMLALLRTELGMADALEANGGMAVVLDDPIAEEGLDLNRCYNGSVHPQYLRNPSPSA
ncbi:hypothetical protein HAX54_022306 [Datura stramonium]|uniref:Uncharacterized protein n=1 Tax=Datura stramonium TaxID=4076 RepID=A0ABS8UVJ6_DATST|nr:hypothetical protein [Datura stramonium]